MVNWSAYFLEPAMLAWFWLLVGFLIMYLIKPKPSDQTIPSLMFILQDKGRAMRNSFLRYLFRDFVMLMQLLILALLISAVAQPYLSLRKDQLVGNSVIVLDASASMQTKDGRWDEAIDIAKNSLSRQNSIILIKNRPEIIGRELTKSEAETLLESLEPSDTQTNLYAGIVASREFVHGADSIVTIISDFKNTDVQQDYRAAATAIIATGASVNLKGVGGQVQNTGIISMSIDESKTRIGVRNYRTDSVVATLKVAGFEQAVPLSPGATEFVTIQTPPGVTEVQLEPKDDFMVDNTAVIANGDRFDLKILILTNDDDIKKRPIWYALESIDQQTPLNFAIDIVSPPALPSIEHDVVIFSNVDPSLLVQRTIRETADNVKNGKSAIIMGQPDLFGIDYEEMVPMVAAGKGGATSVEKGEFSSLTKDVEFGDVAEYHKVVKPAGRVLAVASDSESPIISIIPLGTGNVLFYGIDDRASSFPLEPTYPVFWKRALDEITGRVAIERLNMQTGETPLGVAGTPEETPGKMTFDGFFDKQGVYKYSDRTISANLLSAEESDVNAVTPDNTLVDTAAARSEDAKRKELAGIIALIAIILLFLELLIVKMRGDF